jgi:hypothetical protein
MAACGAAAGAAVGGSGASAHERPGDMLFAPSGAAAAAVLTHDALCALGGGDQDLDALLFDVDGCELWWDAGGAGGGEEGGEEGGGACAEECGDALLALPPAPPHGAARHETPGAAPRSRL